MKMSTLLIIASSLLAASWASAQTVWRCGPEGRSYSSTPCAEGRAVDVSDPRSAEEQRAAQAVVDREWRLAQTLAHQRALREGESRAALGTGMAALGPLAPVAPLASAAPRSKLRPKATEKANSSSLHRQSRSGPGTSRATARETRYARG
jgi:hypothetical protein